jgi:hypothetical protein
MNGYNAGYNLCSGNSQTDQLQAQSQAQSSENENNNALSQSQETKIYICKENGCTEQ